MKTRMRGTSTTLAGLVMALCMVLAAVAVNAADGDADAHDVTGRYSIESAAGGAVWAFQSGGELIVIGPADLMATGAWIAVPGSRSKFDATLDVDVTSQRLQILGEVSPDRSAVALYVAATPPDEEQNALPWPLESRLVGQSLGIVGEPTPVPSPDAMACLRPTWVSDRLVDWEPCGSTGDAQPSASAPIPADSPPP